MHTVWLLLSCLPGFHLWYHRHLFVQLVNNWCPYQLQRGGYLSSCSLRFELFLMTNSYSAISCKRCELRPKLVLGVGVPLLVFDETCVYVIRTNFANCSVIVSVQSAFSYARWAMVEFWRRPNQRADWFRWYALDKHCIFTNFGCKSLVIVLNLNMGGWVRIESYIKP